MSSTTNAPSSLGRVMIGLSDVAGYFSGLERGFRSLGVDARFHNLSANPLAYGRQGATRSNRLLRLGRARRGSLQFRAWTWLLAGNRALRRIRTAALFPVALVRYDTFILGGHETFLGGMDLALMRWMRKRVVIVFTGSDHRPPYLSGSKMFADASPKALAKTTKKLRRRVATAERHATAVVALPESAQLHRREFIDFLAIGIPVELPVCEPRTSSDSDHQAEIRVLHCPTDPAAKGTPLVRATVDRCRERGVSIGYTELVGKPNAEVLAALNESDIIVDELYSDTPMAKFAAEAASFGKPTIVGSYAALTYANRPGAGPATPPTCFCEPEAFEEALMQLATDREARRSIGQRAKDFVSSDWTSSRVAERLSAVAMGAAPPEWIVRPEDLTYVHGWGQSESALAKRIGTLIREEGVEALCLQDGGRLLRELQALAASQSR